MSLPAKYLPPAAGGIWLPHAPTQEEALLAASIFLYGDVSLLVNPIEAAVDRLFEIGV